MSKTLYYITTDLARHEEVFEKLYLISCKHFDYLICEGFHYRSYFGYWGTFWKDMKEISQLFPNVLFTVNGMEENTIKNWKVYFVNGRYQYAPARLIFDGYDEEKLKDIIA